MLRSNLLFFVIPAIWLLPFGHSLKCYSYICSKASQGPSPSCTPPQEITCSSVIDIPMAPDRCVTQRFLLEMYYPEGGSLLIEQEMRNCSYSFQCGPSIKDMMCDTVNASSGGSLKKCEMGCCEKDLCNSGGPIPTQAPGPTGPSGADLSCYSCSNIPGTGLQENCSNPVIQNCGGIPIPFFPPHDRCVTVKGEGKFSGYNQSMKFELKNCSNELMCNQEFVCSAANASANGSMKSCQVSCCFGNLCNADGAMKSAATATGTDHILAILTYVSAFVLYISFILIL